MHEIAKRAAAIGLSLGVLGAPAVVHAEDSIAPRDLHENFDPSELELDKYDLPLNVLREMVDVKSPSIAPLYDKVAGNPQEYFEIIDKLGYKDLYFPGGYTYLIFSEPNLEHGENPRVSIAIFVDAPNEVPVSATIQMQLDSELGVFGVGDASIPEFAGISELALEMVSEGLFKEPREMTRMPWQQVDVVGSEFPIFQKEHVAGDGAYFFQSVGPDNVITFHSNEMFQVNE